MKKALLLSSFILFIVGLNAQDLTVIFEEQFDGGIPADWEIGPGEPAGAVWQWSATGRANNGLVNGMNVNALFWGDRGPIQSPSVSNGCAMYNSDIYDGGGTGVGQGLFPGTHSGTLTSPSIDCSEYAFVSLRMHQFARANASAVSTLFEVSNDGGATWTDFPINPNVVSNAASPANDFVLVDISEVAANQPDVKLRFTWRGRYYFWLIDDVQLIETPANNLSIGDFFYAPASYAQPVSQIVTDTMGFSADISNRGREALTNVVLRVTITDSGNNIVHRDSVVLPELAPFTYDSTVVIEDFFVPDMLTVGSYTLRYDVYSLDDPDDFDPRDNSASAVFAVTESLFSMDDGVGIGGVRPGTGGDYRMGNYYRISPVSPNVVATHAIFAAGKNTADGPIAGEQVTVLLYKVKDNVLLDFSNFSPSGNDDLDVVGFQTYEFPEGYTNYNDARVELLDFEAEPTVQLEAGGRYFLVVSYEGSANNIFAGNDRNIKFFQISTVVFTTQWFLGGFGADRAAVVRMEIALPVNTNEALLPEYSLAVFPNPTAERVNVTLGLDARQDAMVILADMNGKIFMMQEYQGVQDETFSYDVSNLPAGMYMVRIGTRHGISTKKFVVAR
jgi:hypothetical protein